MTVLGPINPAPGGNSLFSSGNAATDGGATLTFSGFDFDLVSDMWWGLNGITAAMDGTVDSAGESLTFSGFSGGGLTATWLGTTAVDGYSGTVYTKLVVTIQPASSGTAHWIAAADASLTTGPAQVIDVDESLGAFTVNISWQASVLSHNVGLDSFSDIYNFLSSGPGDDILAAEQQFLAAAINFAPAGSDKALALDEDQSLTFTAADFGFSDNDDLIADGLSAVIISTLPSEGLLTLSGVPVTTGQTIDASDIADLLYTPAGDFHGSDSLTFQVVDSSGEANDTDVTPNTLSLTVAPVNDPHTGTVTIDGIPALDETLTAIDTTADVDGKGTVSYQWLRDGGEISGATDATYVVTADDLTHDISVRLSFTDNDGTLETETSAEVTAGPVELRDSTGTLLAAYTSIQAAVDAAGAGDHVVLQAGTYVEQVSVDGKTGLVIEAAAGADVTIQAPADVTYFVLSGSSRELNAVVSVSNSTNVEIKGITVDGDGRGNSVDEGGGPG